MDGVQVSTKSTCAVLVRFWPLADIIFVAIDVRISGYSRHRFRCAKCLLMTQLIQRSTRLDSMIANFNSTVLFWVLFQQHRRRADIGAARLHLLALALDFGLNYRLGRFVLVSHGGN